MRWIRYEAEGTTSYGIIEGDEIDEVSGSPFGSYVRTGARRALDSVRVLVPVVPRTFLLRGAQLRRPSEGRRSRTGALRGGRPKASQHRVPGKQRADSARGVDRRTRGRDREGAVRGRACGRHRQAGEARVRVGGVLVRARVYDRERCKRAHVAGLRQHDVALEEHGHLQADGTMDRDGRRPPRRWRRR